MKYFTILFLLITFSCEEKNKESQINGFDISSDAKEIVYSYKSDSLYCIFRKNILTGKSILIYKGTGNYINPKYIDDGKIIVFLNYPQNMLEPEFYFYDISSKKITKKVKVDEGFIYDYTSPTDHKIYYTQAQIFDSHSPIAPKSYHGYDIFELDTELLQTRKISDFKTYFMGEIINYGKDSLLVSMQGEPGESGFFMFNKNEKMNTLSSFSRVVIKNDTLRNSEMYRNPILLSNDNVLCASSYQMVKLNLKNKLEQAFLPSTGYHYSQIRKSKNLIFYKQQDDTDSLYYFDLNTKILKSIFLKP